MAGALRRITIERGRDPRDFAMVAQGGGGPIHAVDIARELSIRTVLVPELPATFSAAGMLVANVRHDNVHSVLSRLDEVEPAGLEAHYRRLEAAGRATIADEAPDALEIELGPSADMRYGGQEHTVKVELTGPLPPAPRSQRASSGSTADCSATGRRAFRSDRLDPGRRRGSSGGAGVVIIIPLFFQMRSFGLLNTYWSVILPQIAIILPFGTVLTRNFMLDVPGSLLDAGTIDGCNSWQLLWLVIVPCIRPALASLVIFSFMWTWNQLFLPMVMITDTDLRPLPVGLTYFQGQFGTNVPVLAAAAIVASLPVVIMYLLFQRHFIRGLTVGAIKG